MKVIFKITAVVIALLVVWFVCYLCGLQRDYSEGISLVTQGEYERAYEIFVSLDGYQDAEVLAEYCAVMAEYDAFDYASVFRSYHNLNGIEIDNAELEVEVAAARAEISALYVHCGNGTQRAAFPTGG